MQVLFLANENDILNLDLNDFYLVLGKKRSGKTYFTKKEIIEMVIASGKRIIIIDNITSEYGYLGLPVVKSLSDLRSKSVEFLQSSSYRIKLSSGRLSKDDVSKNSGFKNKLNELQGIFEIIYNSGNCFLVYEEAGIDLQGVSIPILSRISFGGRHKNIGASFNTQRPRKLPADILSQSVNFFIFKITDNYDLMEITKRFGKDFVDKIKGLDNNSFIVVSNEEYQGVFRSAK